MAKLLEVKDLSTQFYTDYGVLNAVNGVSCVIEENTTLGVVGESGCGKSVTARSIMGILGTKGKIVSGAILLHNHPDKGSVTDISKLDPKGREIRSIRGKIISIIFQEPMSSFSMVYTIGNQIIEAILLHQDVKSNEAREMAIDLLDKVGIPKPQQRIDEFPHQMSGGMLQRAMIAMALSCHPKLLIADEPTTSLDVTTQAQVLDIMRQLQAKLGMSIMMITHNLGVISEISEKVVVMYLGNIVESANVKELFANPLHPYTQGLFRSIPKIGQDAFTRLESIKGEVPDALNIPPGCSFHPRCPMYREGLCDVSVPPSIEVSDYHTVKCFFVHRDS